MVLIKLRGTELVVVGGRMVLIKWRGTELVMGGRVVLIKRCIHYTFFYIFLIQFELELCELDAQQDAEQVNHIKSFMPNSFLSGFHLNAVTCTMLQ